MWPRDAMPARLLLLRQPLTTLLVIGCAASMMASGRITARLIVDAGLSFAFVPAAQLVAFAAVHRSRRASLPPAALIDTHLRGNLPWLWYLLAVASMSMCVAGPARGDLGPLLATAPVPVVLGVIADWRFFRRD